MKVKTLGILVLVLVLGIFLFGIVKAESCSIKTIAQCNSNGDLILFKLYSTDNAHAGDTSSMYTYGVCCDFGQGADLTCTGLNEIIRLSNSQNAHAESPDNPSHQYPLSERICLENAECVFRTSGACTAPYSFTLYTLSSDTNAHVGSGYGNRVCCDITVPPQDCSDMGGQLCVEGEVCRADGASYPAGDVGNQACCQFCCPPNTCQSDWCTDGYWDDGCGHTLNCDGCTQAPYTGDCCVGVLGNFCCEAGECCNAAAGGFCYPLDNPCNPPDNDFECGWHKDNCLINDWYCGDCLPGDICEMPAGTCCTYLTQEEACAGKECGNAPVGCGLPEISCGNCDDPSKPICEAGICVPEPETCTITGVYWINDSSNSAPIMEGKNVQIGVDAASDCDGELIHFTLFEQDQGSDIISIQPLEDEGGLFFSAPGPGTTTWKAEYHNDTELIDDGEWPEYYIKAEITGFPSLTSRDSSGTGYALLYVEDDTNITPGSCDGITLCENYLDEGNCTSDWCEVADWTINSTFGKGCGITGCGNESQPNLWYSQCGCEWTGDEATGSCGYKKQDNPCTDCGNGIREQGEVCDTLNFSNPAGGDWICEDFDEYTPGTLLCNLNCTLNFTQCGNWQPCNPNNLIETGEVCDGTDLTNPDGGTWSCTDFDDFIGGPLGCIDCDFDYSGCNIGEPTTPGIGTCHHVTEPVNGCDEPPVGLLTTSWGGTYEWDDANEWGTETDCIANSLCDGSASNPCIQTPTGSGEWHCSFANAYQACIAGGSATMECPAEIQLLFFGKYQIIASVLLIASIYGFIVFRKRS